MYSKGQYHEKNVRLKPVHVQVLYFLNELRLLYLCVPRCKTGS